MMIDRGVAKGSHFVECQLMGEEGKPSPPFKILCVFSPAPLTTSDSCWPVCTLADVLFLLFLAVVSSRRKPFSRTNNKKKNLSRFSALGLS